ncbi:DEAD/DEAH box helicase family protein [Leptospira noguchii]|nr:DEAD/DEAH box helicase family protein [Leptospira noguchii]
MKSEKETRKDIIDQRLQEAGWNLQDRTQVIEEFDIEVKNSNGFLNARSSATRRQFSDYVLLGKNGKPLAVVEGKKTSKDASLGREQAKQYCYFIQEKYGGPLPFCFYTNGYDIYFWDLEIYPPKKVYGFPTREDLERYSYLRDARKPLASELINTNIAGRGYQIASIRAVMEAIEKKRRKFLLVMATGTGKTRTCVALVDVLMRSGWINRTLFLVDRIALRKQTLDAFKEYLPNEPIWPKSGEQEISSERRIYVSTYPTMLNSIRDERRSLSPHFFDLVVVDESHRSIYNTYQEILDYFNTITLGLTATPTDVIDHNTFRLFECEDGVPYIKTGDIKNGKIIVSGLSRTSKEIAKSYKRSEVKSGDIIMSIRATVGAVALLPNELDGANLTQGTARISPRRSINRFFLYHFLLSDNVQVWINKQTKGATFREITLSKLRELPVLVPPISEQFLFAEFVQHVETQRVFYQNSLTELESLYSSLSQKAFRGELTFALQNNLAELTQESKSEVSIESIITKLNRKGIVSEKSNQTTATSIPKKKNNSS